MANKKSIINVSVYTHIKYNFIIMMIYVVVTVLLMISKFTKTKIILFPSLINNTEKSTMTVLCYVYQQNLNSVNFITPLCIHIFS